MSIILGVIILISFILRSNGFVGPTQQAIRRIQTKLLLASQKGDVELKHTPVELREPSTKCGHVFVLHCAASGIAADAILNDDSTPIISFLNDKAKALQGEWSKYRRQNPLIALDLSSSNMSDILTQAYEIVDEYGVDVALCIPDESIYLSTRALQQSLCPFEGGPFWMLSDRQKKSAKDLAINAKIGRLSVFVGAGVSFASGAPSWGGLLEQIAEKSGMSEEDRESLKDLNFLDQPTILGEDMGDAFKPAIAEIVADSSHYTPAHALLKSLKLRCITTNYDTLYEMAAESCNQNVSILPWDSRTMIDKVQEETSSLMKLHGCINHPESIILSREDYMRYPDTCQALRGHLHGIFLTSKVLFVGFSMTDDNVHKVIDGVRKVLYKNDKPDGKLGTILSWSYNKMFNRLWDQDFDIESFNRSSFQLDCFIDYIVASYNSYD